MNCLATGGHDLPDVVLAEVAWVLRGYALDRDIRFQLMELLVRTRGVVVDDIDAVITYAFRGQDAPSQDSMPESSSLSDQEAVLCAADSGIGR